MTYNSSKTGAQVDSVVDAGLPGGSTLYGVSNLLGTVSQSGGVPTGAVIERGSNANGRYVKFADGTLILTQNFSGVDVTTADGSLFVSALVRWDFPIAALTSAATSFHAVSVSANAETVWGLSNVAQSFANLYLYSTASILNRTVWATAIGRWF